MVVDGRCQKRSDGQAVVEMALVLPILLLILFGVLDLGRAIYAQFTLAQAAREGARRAIIETTTNAVIRQAVIDKAVGLGVVAADITIGGSRTAGQQVTVAVTHVFHPVTPFISNIVGSALQLRSSTSMTME
jgi:Flp pilus assembly protein TadG